MDNKKKNEIVALVIVILVSGAGFAFIFWFYTVIAPLQNSAPVSTQLDINNEILDKVTNDSNSSPLQLEDSDFGRSNPFQSL